MSVWVRALILVACFAWAGVSAPTFARDTRPDAPAIWRIDGPKGTVHFFGSVHLLPQGVNWRTPALDAALTKADSIAFEIDMDEAQNPAAMQQLIQKLGLLPPGTMLRKLLAPEQRTKLERVSAAVGIPAQGLDGFRPWLAAVTVGVQWIISKGYDPNSGVDPQVWAWAKQAGKKRVALETVESQLGAFAGLTREQEIEYLIISLDQIEETPEMLAELVQAWRKGDTKALDKLLNDSMRDLPALTKRMLNDRHDRWLPQIEQMLAQGGNHVIVVGTAHLVGPESVIAMLRAKGVKIEGP